MVTTTPPPHLSSSQIIPSLPASEMDKRRPLPLNFQPTSSDVLCGKGKMCFNHSGNRRFRSIVGANLKRYQAAQNKLDKSAIVNEIVEIIRKDCKHSGGFIRPDATNSRWFEIGDEAAREKVGQVIRDAMLKQDPDGLEKKLHKRKARASERRERKCAVEQGQSVNLRTTNEPRLLLVKKPKLNRKVIVANNTPSRATLCTKSSGARVKVNTVPLVHLTDQTPIPVQCTPIPRNDNNQKKRPLTVKEVTPPKEESDRNAPIDFYEKLRKFYRENEETDQTSVSTYSGRDTADETSDLSDDEHGEFFEEEGQKAIYV